MKLSTRSRYGTRAMLEIARCYNKNPINRKDIIRHQRIPTEYLANILLTLKGRGLINTSRGASGGYSLSRPPSKVTLYHIVEALEGSIAPVECVENAARCRKSAQCVVRKAWTRLHDAQLGVLRSISLQDLLEMEKAEDGAAMYFI